MSKHVKISEVHVDRFLELLADGSCPFLSIAADRAGLGRYRVERWLHIGSQPDVDEDSLEYKFAVEVRRIQGIWKSRALRKMEGASKDNAEAARQIGWLLIRLDRETFDVSRPALNAPKGESNKPQVPTSESASQASKDLEGDPVSH